jgi:alkylhydroperoxidase family enzyme
MVKMLVARAEQLARCAPDEGLAQVDTALASLEVSAPDRALLAFVTRLTLYPRSNTRQAIESLRRVGYGDVEIHDVVHVVACFSYMNRLADGLGVVVLPHKYEAARWLLGDAALQRHLAWGGAEP